MTIAGMAVGLVIGGPIGATLIARLELGYSYKEIAALLGKRHGHVS